MKRVFVFVGGYPRCGKTTFMNYVRESCGYYGNSTSEILYDFTSKLMGSWFDFDDSDMLAALKEKDNRFTMKLEDDYTGVYDPLPGEWAQRELLIKTAEEALVPVFGRELFARASVINAMKSGQPICFLESIGGEEYAAARYTIDQIHAYMPRKQQPIVMNINLRRHDESEVEKLDIRELLPGAYDLYHKCDSNYYPLIDDYLTQVNYVLSESEKLS